MVSLVSRCVHDTPFIPFVWQQHEFARSIVFIWICVINRESMATSEGKHQYRSYVELVTTRMRIHIHPSKLLSLDLGVIEHLNSLLLRYVKVSASRSRKGTRLCRMCMYEGHTLSRHLVSLYIKVTDMYYFYITVCTDIMKN